MKPFPFHSAAPILLTALALVAGPSSPAQGPPAIKPRELVRLAVANEIMRAVLSFDTWLTTKVWGVPIVSLVFAAANVPMLLRHGLEADSKKDVVSEAPIE